MGVVERFNKKLAQLEAAINQTIKETIIRDEPFIINQQANEQLYKQGEDGNAKPLIPSYASSTIKYKKRKGQITDHVTLRDTGRMYKSIFVDALTNEMIISINVYYFKYLVLHYDTNEILGLQPSFLKQFVLKRVLPNLKKEFKKIIKSK